MSIFNNKLNAVLNEAYSYGGKKYRDLIEVLRAIYKEHGENSFVTYTDIEKVGINPKVKFDTPVGIYSYPLSYVLEKNLDPEFAADRPYLNVFVLKDSTRIVELNETDFGFTPKFIRTGLDEIPLNSDFYDEEDLTFTREQKEIINYYIEDNLQFLPKQVANFLRPKCLEVLRNFEMRSDHSLLWLLGKEVGGDNPARWNKFFRDVRIDGFSDNGTGTIHPNEPWQTVVFSTRAIEVIARFENVIAQGARQRYYDTNDRLIQFAIEDNVNDFEKLYAVLYRNKGLYDKARLKDQDEYNKILMGLIRPLDYAIYNNSNKVVEVIFSQMDNKFFDKEFVPVLMKELVKYQELSVSDFAYIYWGLSNQINNYRLRQIYELLRRREGFPLTSSTAEEVEEDFARLIKLANIIRKYFPGGLDQEDANKLLKSLANLEKHIDYYAELI